MVISNESQAFLVPVLSVTLRISILATVHVRSSYAANFPVKFTLILSFGVFELGDVASLIGIRQTLGDTSQRIILGVHSIRQWTDCINRK